MTYFAKLDSSNIVIFVVCGRDEDNGKEQELSARTGSIYKQTSFNTHGGIYYDPITNSPAQDQSKAFRKNFAGIGYKYDEIMDAFIPPQNYPSWVLNPQTCLWEAPIPYPPDGKDYKWDESTKSWVLVTNGG